MYGSAHALHNTTHLREHLQKRAVVEVPSLDHVTFVAAGEQPAVLPVQTNGRNGCGAVRFVKLGNELAVVHVPEVNR